MRMLRAFAIFGTVLFSTISSQAFDKGNVWKETKPGQYAKKIETLVDRWAQGKVNVLVKEKKSELNLTGIKTPDDSTYMGILAKTTVAAKLDSVIDVLKDIAKYTDVYPGLDEIKFTKEKENDFDIHWKFSGPMGSHTIYDTAQTVSKLRPTRGVLVYQLKKSDDVVETDGLIFLQEEGGQTKYLSVDFFNAKWGIAGTFFKGKIWETTFDNTKKATLTIKENAEKKGKSSEESPEKVSVNYSGLDDREKQKTFEALESEIFDEGTSDQSHSQ